MKKRASLSFRIALYLLLAQIVALGVAPLSSYFISVSGLDLESDATWYDWGEIHARALVAASLVRVSTGFVDIEPSAALRAYIQDNPEFRFAAFDSATGAAVPGSAPELVAAISEFTHIRAFYLAFQIVGKPHPFLVGNYRKTSSPVGVTPIAVYGYSFHWGDLPSLALSWFTAPNILGLSPIIFGGIGIAWLMARRLGAFARRGGRGLARKFGVARSAHTRGQSAVRGFAFRARRESGLVPSWRGRRGAVSVHRQRGA